MPMDNQTEQEVVAPQVDAPVEKDVTAVSSPAQSSPDAGVIAQPTEPKFEKSIPYERFSKAQKERDSLRDELRKAQENNQKMMELYQNLAPKPQTNQQSLEQQEAARQLAEILFNQPQFKGLYDKLQSLESRTGEYSQSAKDSAFDKEEESLGKWCETRGINLNEIKPELQEWLDTHPRFSKVELQPGDYTLAAQAIYAERHQEFAERAANLKLIKEQEAKKRGSSEIPGSSVSPKGAPKEKMEDWLAKRGEELGVFGS